VTTQLTHHTFGMEVREAVQQHLPALVHVLLVLPLLLLLLQRRGPCHCV
jgi:hypothetical protein